MVTTVLLLTGIALSLIVAGFGYCHGSLQGKGVFGPGVIMAVGLLALASVACSQLPDSLKADRQVADEAAACLQAGYGEEFAVLFPNGKDGIADTLVQTSSREQLVTYRDQKCGKGVEDPASLVSDSGSGLENPFRGSNPGCTSCSNIQEMMDEYDANPLRAERNYKGRTIVVGGKIKTIEEDFAVPPRPLVRLRNDVSLLFSWEGDHSWLLEKNVGDSIEAQCLVEGFRGPASLGPTGTPRLSECGRVPE